MKEYNIIGTIYEKEAIDKYREKVEKEFKEKSLNVMDDKIYGVSPLDLKILFNLYDKYFFNNFFKGHPMKLSFSVSKRMKRAAGKTIYKRIRKNGEVEESYEIRMGIDFFTNFYIVDREKKVSGKVVKSALEAMMVVFEHEMCHLIEFYLFKESSCKKARFKTLAKNLFNHSSSYHELVTEKEIQYYNKK